jgi:hypothetical protein
MQSWKILLMSAGAAQHVPDHSGNRVMDWLTYLFGGAAASGALGAITQADVWTYVSAVCSAVGMLGVAGLKLWKNYTLTDIENFKLRDQAQRESYEARAILAERAKQSAEAVAAQTRKDFEAERARGDELSRRVSELSEQVVDLLQLTRQVEQTQRRMPDAVAHAVAQVAPPPSSDAIPTRSVDRPG